MIDLGLAWYGWQIFVFEMFQSHSGNLLQITPEEDYQSMIETLQNKICQLYHESRSINVY